MPQKVPPYNSAGQYRRKLAIQQPGTTQDEYGHTLDNWTDVVNPIWGSITPYRGYIKETAGQVLAEMMFTIEIRYRPNINKTMRIVDLNMTPNRYYRIFSISDMNLLHQKLSILVTEYA